MNKSRRGKCIDCGKEEVFLFSQGRCRSCWEIFKSLEVFHASTNQNVSETKQEEPCNHLIGIKLFGFELQDVRINDVFVHFKQDPSAELNRVFKYCPDCGKELSVRANTQALQFETTWEIC